MSKRKQQMLAAQTEGFNHGKDGYTKPKITFDKEYASNFYRGWLKGAILFQSKMLTSPLGSFIEPLYLLKSLKGSGFSKNQSAIIAYTLALYREGSLRVSLHDGLKSALKERRLREAIDYFGEDVVNLYWGTQK